MCHRIDELGIHDPAHLDRPSTNASDLLHQIGQKIRFDPIQHELVLRPQRQNAFSQVVELNATKPLVECRR